MRGNMELLFRAAASASTHSCARRIRASPAPLLSQKTAGHVNAVRLGYSMRTLSSSTAKRRQPGQSTEDDVPTRNSAGDTTEAELKTAPANPAVQLSGLGQFEETAEGSPAAPPSSPPDQSAEQSAGRGEARNSLDDLLRGLNLTEGPRDRQFASPYGSPQRQRVDTSRMAFPESPYRDEFDYFAPFPQVAATFDTAAPPFRLGPQLGRTVKIEAVRRIDLGKAFRMLEQKCGANKVRHDMNKQKFHERPGLKRKRLKSSRWRKRFKLAFQATVRRVDDMRRKGW